jgi:hypothetical protein
LLVLVAILAALGAYIYFVESKKPQGPEANLGPKIFDVKADDIVELLVKAESGEQTTLKKSNGAWSITSPVVSPADENVVSGLVSNLATVDNFRPVDDNVTDFAQFGLADPPRIEVAFKTAKDSAFKRLLIGDKTAAMGDLYARLPGDKKVFLIASSFESSFNKTTFDLRDKQVLAIDRDKVERLVLEAEGRVTELVRSGGEWSLVRPIQGPADYGTVESVISRLQTAQMKAITALETGDPKTYGLDKPVATATVVSGSSRAVLQLGGSATADTVYARTEGRPLVYTVEASLADELKKPADQLRRKDLFAFRSYTATALTITRGADTLAFEKVKVPGTPPSEKWRQTKPATKDLDNATFDTFLAKLSSIRAESFVDAGSKTVTGLDAPVMAVLVRFEDGKKEETVTFGRHGADVYAAVAGQAGAVQISSTEFDEIVKSLEALK